jgi:hypothetical protein
MWNKKTPLQDDIYLPKLYLHTPKGQSAVFTYKAVFKHDDEQVGQWSNSVSNSVIGS